MERRSVCLPTHEQAGMQIGYAGWVIINAIPISTRHWVGDMHSPANTVR